MRHREQPLAPSQFGFATQPQFHREAKSALLNREQREMTRINGGIVPASTSQADPLHVQPGCALHGGADVRLEAGASAQFLKRQQAEKQVHYQNKIETIKNERLCRDAQRIQGMADELVKWDEDSKRLAGTGLKNRSSQGYNIIDGTWRDSTAASRAKFHDDMVEYYARCRTQKLDRLSNADFNILNGQERNCVPKNPIPKPPVPPDVQQSIIAARTSQEMQARLRDRPRFGVQSKRSRTSVH